MKTVQLNFEPPYLSILLQCLHTAFNAEAQSMVEERMPDAIKIVNVCGIITMHFEIKETIKREMPQLYKLLIKDKNFKHYDETFRGMMKKNFFKKSMLRIELMSKSTEMGLKPTN